MTTRLRTAVAAAVVIGVICFGVVATGGITPAAGASTYGCSNPGYLNDYPKATTLQLQAIYARNYGGWATATAADLAAWRTLLRAPVPCLPALVTSRTHLLRAYANYWRGDTAYGSGDSITGQNWISAGNHEHDLSNAAMVTGLP
jgi:hypothetical protein